MVEQDKEEFKRKFPHLSKELFDKSINIPISHIRSTDDLISLDANKEAYDELRNPDVISFIRRANTDEEALEIIDYCLKRGEIVEDYANELKLQLGVFGVRSFGSKKEPGYYDKKYGKKYDDENDEDEDENEDIFL